MSDVITLRPSRRDNLMISRDQGFDLEPIAVLLYTPDSEVTDDHYHIELDLETCVKLQAWLSKFISDELLK